MFEKKIAGRPSLQSHNTPLRLLCCQHGCPGGVVVITPD